MATGAGGPTGNSLSEKRKLIWGLSSPLRKNILLFRNHKSPYDNAHPGPPEGTYRAIVTDVGHGMRWTQAALAARKRCPMMAQLAGGQAVGAWHPDAGVKLAGAILVATVAYKPGTPGRPRSNR